MTRVGNAVFRSSSTYVYCGVCRAGEPKSRHVGRIYDFLKTALRDVQSISIAASRRTTVVRKRIFPVSSERVRTMDTLEIRLFTTGGRDLHGICIGICLWYAAKTWSRP